MITVTFYFREGQPESLEVKEILTNLRTSIPFGVVQIDIDKDSSLNHVYGGLIPVIQVGPYVLKNPIGRQDLEIALRSALDRESHLAKTQDAGHQKRLQRGHSFSGLDRFMLWLSHHYMALFNGFLSLFIGFALLAPVLMKAGWVGPARVIYTIYSPLCHQLSFRSWFLFGEQAYYPRGLAAVPGVRSFEEAFNLPAGEDETAERFILYSRDYLGDETLGYKTALCQRDLAIYSSFLLFGILFSLNGRRYKPVRWLIWLGLGVIPMALDGASQFPSLMAGLPDWLPIRESTPLLRTVTGFLFGFTSAWYLYPFVEESMRENRAVLSTKKAVVEQSQTVR